MAEIQSTQELYEKGKSQIQAADPSLTDFNEGSILDILTGVLANMVAEAQRTTVLEVAKTFVNSADGPEVTGGDDDLQRLLVDHFGSDFSRPAATLATGIAVFSRPNAAAGSVLILAGTVVKTQPDASGVAQRYETLADVTLTGLTVNASVRAILAGTQGNAQIGKVNVLETTLTDTSVTVNNTAQISGGVNAATDAEYRAYATNLFVSNRGTTGEAIAAKAKTVPGVVQAVPVERVTTVVEYNEATGETSGTPFKVARNTLYIADANGGASSSLIGAVNAAVDKSRAFGVRIEIRAAVAVVQNVVFSATLNGTGPNFATLSVDLTAIIDDLKRYMTSLPIGSGFVRSSAVAAILSKWGPSGSNDLIALSIVSPTAEVGILPNQTLIPGTVTSI